MTDVKKDILGKINAIFEKRDSEVLSEREKSGDDFPTLTDVIPCDIDRSSTKALTSNFESQPSVLEFVEQGCETFDRQSAGGVSSNPTFLSDDDQQLISTIEARMMMILSKHLHVLQVDLRQVIKEEISKISAGNKR